MNVDKGQEKVEIVVVIKLCGTQNKLTEKGDMFNSFNQTIKHV